MAQPSYLTTRLVPIGDGKAGDAESLAARLRQVPGVAEAVVIAEEKLAYLKVDSKSFDAAMAEAARRRALTDSFAASFRRQPAFLVRHRRARIAPRRIPFAAIEFAGSMDR